MNNSIVIEDITFTSGKMGTCTLFRFKDNVYIITNKHVWQDCNEKPFFVVDLRKTKKPKKDYVFIPCVSPKFHPADTVAASYDIAAFKCTKEDEDQIIKIYEPINIDDAFLTSKISLGVTAIAQGYPIDYVESNLNLQLDEKMEPISVAGITCSLPKSAITSINGFKFEVIEMNFLDVKRSLGNGASGGVVYQLVEEKLIPLGLANASFNGLKTFQSPLLNILGNNQVPVNYVVFIQIKRIIEVLQTF
jgi:hypothetical protein